MTFLLPIDALCYTVPVIAAVLAQVTWPEVANRAIPYLFFLVFAYIGYKFFSE